MSTFGITPPEWARWGMGALVRKRKGAEWHGQVCGFYGTQHTAHGYAVESVLEAGSVQIYPEAALEDWDVPAAPRGETVEDEIANHMRPDVLWVENPDFAGAFEQELKEPHMAAHTNSVDPITGGTPVYPSFINARFEGGHVIITMRGDPVRDDQDKVTGPGPQTSARFEQSDWDQFVAEATRERGLVPGG